MNRKINIVLITLICITYISNANNVMNTSEDKHLEAIFESCSYTIANPYAMDKSCQQRLNQYFLPLSIWSEETLIIPRKNYYPRTLFPVYRKRDGYLPYTYLDLSIDSTPRWKDIFDGEIAARQKIVNEVIQDETCVSLHLQRSPMNRELLDRCQARELFKYASYLNGCFTGIRNAIRLGILPINDPNDIIKAKFKDGMELISLDEVNIQFGMDLNRWIRSHLKTVWLLNRCNYIPQTGFDENLELVNFTKGIDINVAIQKHRIGYQVAISISARSGDHWSIYSILPRNSFSMQSEQGEKFWNSIHKDFPLLVHRHLADYVELTVKQRAWHAMKAFMLNVDHDSSVDRNFYEFWEREIGVPPEPDIIEEIIELSDRTFTEGLEFAQEIVDDNLVYPWDL